MPSKRRITGNRTVYLLKIFVLIFIDLLDHMQGSNGVLILDADFFFIGSCISDVVLTLCVLLDV